MNFDPWNDTDPEGTYGLLPGSSMKRALRNARESVSPDMMSLTCEVTLVTKTTSSTNPSVLDMENCKTSMFVSY